MYNNILINCQFVYPGYTYMSENIIRQFNINTHTYMQINIYIYIYIF